METSGGGVPPYGTWRTIREVCPSLSLAGGEFSSSGVTGNGGNVGTRPRNLVPGNVGEGKRLLVSIFCFLVNSADEGPVQVQGETSIYIYIYCVYHSTVLTANPRQCRSHSDPGHHTLKLHKASGKRMYDMDHTKWYKHARGEKEHSIINTPARR